MKGHKLEYVYMEKNRVVVIRQLHDAGTLLASCLESVLGRVNKVPAGPNNSTPLASQRFPKASKPVINAGTITPDQAAAHIGETVTVCGKVYSTKALNNRPAFLNMGGEYPDNPLTAVIMFDKRSGFSYKPEEYLKGKMICAIGTIKNYKGKPEIVVNKEEQIKSQ